MHYTPNGLKWIFFNKFPFSSWKIASEDLVDRFQSNVTISSMLWKKQMRKHIDEVNEMPPTSGNKGFSVWAVYHPHLRV